MELDSPESILAAIRAATPTEEQFDRWLETSKPPKEYAEELAKAVEVPERKTVTVHDSVWISCWFGAVGLVFGDDKNTEVFITEEAAFKLGHWIHDRWLERERRRERRRGETAQEKTPEGSELPTGARDSKAGGV